MSQATNWTEPVFGRHAKRQYDKALSSCGGLAAGLALLSCNNPFTKGAGLGIPSVSLSTKPNSVTSGGHAFHSLTCICKIHRYTHINICVHVCFNVTANLEYKCYFKVGIMLSFINTYETGLLKLLWCVAHKLLDAWFSFCLFAFKSGFVT